MAVGPLQGSGFAPFPTPPESEAGDGGRGERYSGRRGSNGSRDGSGSGYGEGVGDGDSDGSCVGCKKIEEREEWWRHRQLPGESFFIFPSGISHKVMVMDDTYVVVLLLLGMIVCVPQVEMAAHSTYELQWSRTPGNLN